MQVNQSDSEHDEVWVAAFFLQMQTARVSYEVQTDALIGILYKIEVVKFVHSPATMFFIP